MNRAAAESFARTFLCAELAPRGSFCGGNCPRSPLNFIDSFRCEEFRAAPAPRGGTRLDFDDSSLAEPDCLFVLSVDIQPEEAYGPVNADLIQAVPLSAFEGVEKVEPGMQFQAGGADGQEQPVKVVSVTEDVVTVDANHPLAGEILHFDVTIEAIRAATEEELEHGHAH